jgi:hypothetical protein
MVELTVDMRMDGHSMKRGLGAISMTLATLVAAPAMAQNQAPAPAQPPATLDERLGCGMMLVSFDEVAKVIPALGQRFGGANREGGMAMMRMMAANATLTYNAAFAEAAAQGVGPADTHRRAVAFLAQRFAGVKDMRSGEGRRVTMALFNRCATVMAPPTP